jgi:hypothetical protein
MLMPSNIIWLLIVGSICQCRGKATVTISFLIPCKYTHPNIDVVCIDNVAMNVPVEKACLIVKILKRQTRFLKN